MDIQTVGREDELAAVGAFVDAAAAETGRALLFEGEAGAGKSHLVDVGVARAIAAGLKVFHGRAQETEGDLPFAAILNALGSSARKRATRLIAGSTDAGPELQFLVLELLIDVVEQSLSDGPALLVVDDLQWADPSTVLVVDRLCRSLPVLPLGILVAARSEPRRRDVELLAARIEGAGSRVSVGPLAPDDVAVLASLRLGAPPGPRLLGVLAQAAGNAFFALETLSALAPRIDASAGQAEVTDVDLPASLHELIVRRIDFLPDDTLALLRIAAVLGTEFDLDDVCPAVTTTPAKALELLGPAVRASVVDAAGSTFRFRHDLVRSALYESTPPPARTALHGQIAGVLADVGRPATSVAPHLLASARRGDDEAVNRLYEAASQIAPQAPGVAVGVLRRTLDIAGARSPRRYDLEVALARALLWSDQIEEAERLARRLLADRERGGEGNVRTILLESLFKQGRLAAHLTEIDELVSGVMPGAERPHVLARAAGAFVVAADLERGEELARAALAAASIGDDAARSVALVTLARAASIRGEGRQSFRLLEEAAALVLGGAGPDAAFEAVSVLVHTLVRSAGRPDDALALAREGLRVVEAQGLESARGFIHGALATVHYHGGRLGDAASEFETAVQVAGERRTRVLVPIGFGHLAHIEALRGDIRAARRWLRAASMSAGQQSDPNLAPEFDLLWPRAFVDELDGRDADALATLDVLRQRAAETAPQFLAEFAWVGLTEVRIAARVGDRGLAREAAHVVEMGVDRVRTNWPVEPWLTAYMDLAWGLVEDDDERLHRACDVLRGLGRPMLHATACEEAGRVSAVAGRRADAIVLLEEARDLWTHAGARRKARQVVARLRALGVRGARGPLGSRPASGWGSLTATESEIAGLVAEGLTYRAIAERMLISRRTVETHVSHIFAKLHISSRAALAAEVRASSGNEE